MPFGKKPDLPSTPKIDFDAIYEQALRPGIEDAGMTPIRATRRSSAASSTRRCSSVRTEASLAKKDELLPVVRFALGQRAHTDSADYWAAATRLELSVLDNDIVASRRALGEALITGPEAWQRETTAGNLGLIRRARA